ncbi:50S ribosomal protein L3 [bacterium]|nr:50S ribosomal protein L3 [bacterium]
MKGMLGRKLGMSRVYEDGRKITPVTLIDVDDCYVIQSKTVASDGYAAVQLGISRRKRATKPLRGHLKKAKLSHSPLRIMELRGEFEGEVKAGTKFDTTLFAPGDKVDVIGWTKGRGFAGGMKRHGWHGGPETHGSNHHRRIGSAGQTTYPGRVLKGHSMPGHYGNERQTIHNLRVVKVDPERNLLYLKGSVPGPTGGVLLIRKVEA